jgi:pimeloyl-ACP methyl ester carboxylesterase
LVATLLVAIGTLLANAAPPSGAQDQESPVRLVVVVLRGWNSASGDPSFAEIVPVLERLGTAPEINRAVSVEEFSYRYPEMTYERCDTNQSLAASRDRLNAQLQDLATRHSNARFLVVGHSLGGVIATYWAANNPSPELLRRTAGVVTLSSPLRGVNEVPPEIRDLVETWMAAQLCFDARLLAELNPEAADSPVATLARAIEALAANEGQLYNGASSDDIAISPAVALLPGAEWRVFESGVCPDWSALRALTPELTDDPQTTDWSRLRMRLTSLPIELQLAIVDRLSRCVTIAHSGLLRDPAVAEWLAAVAVSALVDTTPTRPRSTTEGLPAVR